MFVQEFTSPLPRLPRQGASPGPTSAGTTRARLRRVDHLAGYRHSRPRLTRGPAVVDTVKIAPARVAQSIAAGVAPGGGAVSGG
ncbi:hypothetical protein AB0B45_19685 [Nonomuraea sp. NPDC049152]|uniref:hypothetical protein n=1 Tax=Nonomuraea sp. NPDC049152 TaxID=3154350 RepID=UPI0033FDC5D4